MKFFDEIVQFELGIPAGEFLKNYWEGKYDGIDVDNLPGLDEVIACLPFASSIN